MEQLQALRRSAMDWISGNEARLSAFNARIWSHAEPAWREYRSMRDYVEILRAEGDKQAAVLRAQGEAEAIQNVFSAIHQGAPDDKLLAYQYLQMLPKISEGPSNKLWIVPSELTEALKGIGSAFTPKPGQSPSHTTPNA